MTWTVAALYKFTPIEDREGLQAALKAACKDLEIFGSLLVASEGINGTICAPDADKMADILTFMQLQEDIGVLEVKYSTATLRPFRRMKVRLKKEIVTLKQPQVDPNRLVGTYVEGEAWNKIISDPDVVVIDTRNDYEVEIGTFKNALDPKTKEFNEFPEFVQKHLDPAKHKKVAMFCTGGIRCEKASSYMLSEGFEEVYHLKGGILKYLEDMPREKSLWDGECYVFDHRVSVGHGLEEGTYDYCFGCGFPIDEADKQSNAYEEGISCSRCIADLTPEKRKALTDRHAHLKSLKDVA